MELLIAISLVAILSTGMLFAMRTSALTHEKIGRRLDENRRSVGVERIIASQLGGVMGVMSVCPGQSAPVARDRKSTRLNSSH